VLVRDEDEEGGVGYVAQVRELPGCISQGDTPEEAFENVRDAMYGWIKVAVEDGKAIPEPAAEPTYGGQLELAARFPDGDKVTLFVTPELVAAPAE
jgi:antitoxin HicB